MLYSTTILRFSLIQLTIEATLLYAISPPWAAILARIAVAIKSWAVVAPNTFHKLDTIIGQPGATVHCTLHQILFTSWTKTIIVTVHQPRLGSLRGAFTPHIMIATSIHHQSICSFIQFTNSHIVQKSNQFTHFPPVGAYLFKYSLSTLSLFLQVTTRLTNLTL